MAGEGVLQQAGSYKFAPLFLPITPNRFFFSNHLVLGPFAKPHGRLRQIVFSFQII